MQAFDGAHLEYEVVGEGPPLVMLHGALASRFIFSRQREELANHYRLVMLSARGHDGSETRLPRNYGVASSDVDDLHAVLNAEGFNQVNLLGHSSGGATAFFFARRYPERVSRLVLIEPALYALLPRADYDAIKTACMAVAATADSKGPKAGLRAAMEFLAGDAWSKLDAETQAKRLQALASSAPIIGPHIHGVFEAMVTEADVRALRPPALLLYGVESFPFESVIANRFRALRPDLRVVTAEKAAHNVHRDRPDIVNAEVVAFLAA